MVSSYIKPVKLSFLNSSFYQAIVSLLPSNDPLGLPHFLLPSDFHSTNFYDPNFFIQSN